MVPTNLPSDLITVRRGATDTATPVQTIYAWVRKGHLTGYRRGPRSVLISRAELLELTTPVLATRGDKND